MEFLNKHVFNFDNTKNGGEAFMFETEFFDNGDGELFTNQTITLMSYTNSASFHLVGTQITPEKLRNLANQLERSRNSAKPSMV